MSFKDIQEKRNTRLNQQQPAQNSNKEASHAEATESQNLTSLPTPTPTQTSAETRLYTELDGAGIEIRESKDKGRGLWTTKGIRPGTSLLKLKPHVYCISSKVLRTNCSFCGLEGEVRRCTKCLKVAYCSAKCQKEDWTVHKEECKALIKWAKRAPSESVSIPADIVRIIGRTFWLRNIKKLNSTWWHQLKTMQPNKELFGTSKESYFHLMNAVALYFMGGERDYTMEDFNAAGLESPKDIMTTFQQLGYAICRCTNSKKFTANSFTLTTPTLSSIGVVVSPLAALINHSCDPNAVIVFPRSTPGSPPILNVVAIRPIEPGEEVLASYVDITLPVLIRRQDLLETYSFTCLCELCKTELAYRSSRSYCFCALCHDGFISYTGPYHSDNKEAALTLPDQSGCKSRCTKCHGVVDYSISIEDTIKAAGEGLVKAESMQWTDPQEALDYTFRVLGLLPKLMPPPSHPRLALSRLAQSLLISQMNSDGGPSVDKIIQISAQNRDAIGEILPEGHPIRAVAVTELGKLLCSDEPPISSEDPAEHWPPRGYARLALAKEILVQAKKEIEIGFGSDGSELGDTVRELLVGITKEMSVFKRGVQNAKNAQ